MLGVSSVSAHEGRGRASTTAAARAPVSASEEADGSGDHGGEIHDADGRRSARTRLLLAGLSWNVVGQFAVVGISLGLTPFLLTHLGATQYGIFALASSLRGFLSNLDGGLGPTGYRYLPVYVGAGDVRSTTSLVVTMLSLVVLVVGAIALTFFLIAPLLVSAFSVGSGLATYAHETTYAIRSLMPALLIAALRTPLQRLVMAHHRWAFVSYTQVIAFLAYATIAVTLAGMTHGIECLIWGTYAQEFVLTVVTLSECRHYVSFAGVRWLPRNEVRSMLGFGAKVQVAALASSLNFEVNALLVGAFFPVRDIAYYSIGANFSQQVINLPITGLNPIMQDVGRTYGAEGRDGVLRSFAGAQRSWVRALGVFPLLAALVGWFGIPLWLGHNPPVAPATATILILGTTPLLYNSLVDVTAKILEMPGIESWYLGVGVVLSLACSIPLALTIGVLGIPIGTASGQVTSLFVCIYLARRRIAGDLPSFIGAVDYAAALAAVALAVPLEICVSPSLPTGAVGLVGSGLLTLPAFGVYYLWAYRSAVVARIRHVTAERSTI